MCIDRRRMMQALTAMALTAAVILVGCSGGHGPTFPSPDGGDSPGNTIETEDFVVNAGETVRYDADTTIRCDSARIDGDIVGADGIGPGEAGVSITIEATGDVEVLGTLRAGDGGQAQDAPDAVSTDGDQTAGGDGGAITITSAEGDITVGADAEVRSAQAGAAQLIAGDGAPGGNSFTGGPGGDGGDITLSAPNGTVTLARQAGLIHQGDGGDGGQGRVPADDVAGFTAPAEATSNGGDGGGLQIASAALAGLTPEGSPPVGYWMGTAGMITGGNGGNGGAAVVGEPEGDAAGAEVSPRGLRTLSVHTKQEAEWERARGGNGGDATAPGRPGTGGEASVGCPPGNAEISRPNARADGGLGGDLQFTSPPILEIGGVYRGGVGGRAFASGSSRGTAAQCSTGLAGGNAVADGGSGGHVEEPDDSLIAALRAGGGDIFGGKGGEGFARGGRGAHGGDCCDDNELFTGGDGGTGGEATAFGGAGGDQGYATGGNGGDAKAIGGNGGNGGDSAALGVPSSGGQGGAVQATAGRGGVGSPSGSRGAVVAQTPGAAGSAGGRCAPQPQRVRYGVSGYRSGTTSVSLESDWYTKDVGTGQAGAALGGPSNPLEATVGQSIAFADNNSVAWIGTFNRGLKMFRDPLTGGDREADVTIQVPGQFAPVSMDSVWLDEARDVVYASTGASATIYAWDNASAINAPRQPDRTITLPSGSGIPCITGGGCADRLFATWWERPGKTTVAVFDNASTLNGQVAPNRTIDTGAAADYGLAWDCGRDILYVARDGGAAIDIVTGASAADGQVTPAALTGGATGLNGQIIGLRVDAQTDLLFAGAGSGFLSVWENASGLGGDVAPDKRSRVMNSLDALGLFRQ